MGFSLTDAIHGLGFSGPIILRNYTEPSQIILWLVSDYHGDYVRVLLLLIDGSGGEAHMERGNRVR